MRTCNGAQEKTRTSTPRRAQVPETCASTNSATWAPVRSVWSLTPPTARSAPDKAFSVPDVNTCQSVVSRGVGLPWSIRALSGGAGWTICQATLPCPAFAGPNGDPENGSQDRNSHGRDRLSGPLYRAAAGQGRISGSGRLAPPVARAAPADPGRGRPDSGRLRADPECRRRRTRGRGRRSGDQPRRCLLRERQGSELRRYHGSGRSDGRRGCSESRRPAPDPRLGAGCRCQPQL